MSGPAKLSPLTALMVIGCASSQPAMTNYIPPIPKEALDPCLPAPFNMMMLHDKDVEAVVRQSDAAVAECEAKRRLLVERWPKPQPK